MKRQPLYAGFSKININPKEPIGMDLCGMTRIYRGARGILDNLYARVVYLESGENKFLMIVCDNALTDVISPDHFKVIDELSKWGGIEKKNIWVVSTHCHSAPSEDEAPFSPFMAKVYNRYLDMLIQKLIKCGKDAIKSKQRVKIGYGQTEIEGIGDSRRVKLSDGTVITGWGDGPSPQPGLKIVGRGIFDRDIGLIMFKNMKNKPIGAIVNYNSHIHSYALLYFTSELAGAVARSLDRKIKGITTVYTNGAEGDVSLCANLPSRFMDKSKWNSVFRREMKRMSGIMIKKILGIYKNMKFEPMVKMNMAETVLKIKNSVSGEAIEKISAVTINNLALVGEVEEMVVQYALGVKAGSPFRSTFIIGMNGIRNFYFASTPQMEEGGYEPKLWIKPGSMDRVINASVKLLKKLKRI